MICGKVIGLVRVGGKTIIHLENCRHSPKHNVNECPFPENYSAETNDEKAIHILIGDSMWSHGEWLLWSPSKYNEYIETREMKCGVNYDIKLRRLKE